MQLFDPNELKFERIVDNSEKLGNLCKIINVLCRKNEYLMVRLFQNPHISDAASYGVWLCDHYTWKFVTVNVPV